MLKRVCSALAQLTGAERISISYLLSDRPIILLYHNGIFRPVNDGKLPRRLARVIQTKQPLWFVDTRTLAQLAPAEAASNTPSYKTDFACLLPIVSGGNVYGALSLTDFKDAHLRTRGASQEEMIAIITRFLDHLAHLLERKSTDNALNRQRQASDILTVFTQRLSLSDNSKKSVVIAFLDSITDSLPYQALYFDYDPATARLHLIAGKQLPEEIIKLWAAVPFRAAKENLHAPFPIAVNDRVSVYVGDIRALDRVLVPQSIALFEKCQTRSLFCAPVRVGETVLGLLCLLDRSPHNADLRSCETTLDGPMRFLALALHQAAMQARLNRKDQVIRSFLPPEALNYVTQAESDSPVIGNSFHALLIAQRLVKRAKEPVAPAPMQHAQELAEAFERIRAIANNCGGFLHGHCRHELLTAIQHKEDNKNMPLESCLSYLTKVRQQLNSHDNSQSNQYYFWVLDRGDVFRGIVRAKQSLGFDVYGDDAMYTTATAQTLCNVDDLVLGITERFRFHLRTEFQVAIERCADLTIVAIDDQKLYLFKTAGFPRLIQQVRALNACNVLSGTPGASTSE